MLVNNTIKNFLIIPNFFLYYIPFIKYLWISKILLVSLGLKSAEKEFTITFNPVFSRLLIEKSFEILPKGSTQSFISECFALN